MVAEIWLRLRDSTSRFGIGIQDGGCTLVFDFVAMLVGFAIAGQILGEG